MNYFSKLFTGRINRRNLFFGLVTSLVLIPLGAIVDNLVGLLIPNDIFKNVVIVIYIIFVGCVLLFNISLQVRRWHDLGRSGLSVLFNLIPGLNIFALLYIFAAKGQRQNNKYGISPSSQIRYPQDILNMP